jgi:hypothetical protein
LRIFLILLRLSLYEAIIRQPASISDQESVRATGLPEVEDARKRMAGLKVR